MNDDPRDNRTLLGLAAVAVLAAACMAFAWPARSRDTAFEAGIDPGSLDEAQWVETGQPGEQVFASPGHAAQRAALEQRRLAEEAELEALVLRSEQAVQRSRQAAAEVEARAQAAAPTPIAAGR